MKPKEILNDLVKKNPKFFEQYEQLAQQFYQTLGSVHAIPEAHAAAMITLLLESGYDIKPKANVVSIKLDNVIHLKR